MKKVTLKGLDTNRLSVEEKRKVLGGKMKCWDIINPNDKRCPDGLECIKGICERSITRE